MSEKTSLEKSHSKWSNTKLTALCIIASFAVSLFWLFLGLKDQLHQAVFYVGLGASLVVSVLCLVLFNHFKR